MHATNEQMAEIMGWTLEESGWYDIPDHRGNWTYSNKPKTLLAFFDPTHDLNHTALVEARLRELGIEQEYMGIVASILRMEETGFSYWRMFTASAQTRCDAAWTAYHAWKEQRT